MLYALIVNDRVREIVEADDEAALASRYHPDLNFMPAGEAEVGWYFVDGGLAASAPVVPLTKDELIAYAADRRWRKEIGGITVAGVPVATDDRSKQMILGARVAADADANWTTQWVGADGAIYPIDATAIVAISNAVQAHVNACFATFASVKAEIDAGIIATTTEIDAAFAA